jgi:hypothetical protein
MDMPAGVINPWSPSSSIAGSSHGRSAAAQVKNYQASNFFFQRRCTDTFRDFCVKAIPTFFFGREFLILLIERIIT